ncbi:MAG: 2-hydroxymuconate tautomerase [Alphaproteobacteria bacterium]|jgi:4-oxalocrotonate tautomerase
MPATAHKRAFSGGQMPIIEIHLLEGRDIEKKRKLVAGVTDAVCAALGSRPEQVRVILSDMARHDYAIGGVLVADDVSKK